MLCSTPVPTTAISIIWSQMPAWTRWLITEKTPVILYVPSIPHATVTSTEAEILFMEVPAELTVIMLFDN